MILLLDTNVIIDWLTERDGHDDALRILELAYKDKATECVTATSITDIHYITRKEIKDTYKAQDAISDMLSLITVLPVDQNDIEEALKLRWKDFEDALQYIVAKGHGIDIIVSKNTKDFKDTDIPVMTPREFLKTTEGIY